MALTDQGCRDDLRKLALAKCEDVSDTRVGLTDWRDRLRNKQCARTHFQTPIVASNLGDSLLIRTSAAICQVLIDRVINTYLRLAVNDQVFYFIEYEETGYLLMRGGNLRLKAESV